MGVWPAYPQHIASVLKTCIYRLTFLARLQLFVELRRERMEVALLQHHYDLIDLAVHQIQANRNKIRRRRRRRRRLYRHAGHVQFLRYSYACNTQSTLAIRWSYAVHMLTYAGHMLTYAGHTLIYAGHMLIYAGHTLIFADIRCQYTGHMLLIRYS